jgi:hypothetical protein
VEKIDILRETIKNTVVYKGEHDWVKVAFVASDAARKIGYTLPGQIEWQDFVRTEVKKHLATLQPEPADDEEDEWICTRDLPPFERREAILDYLDEVGKPQTRSQIEIGAGYRRADERLPPEDYKALKRQIQRALKDLVEQGLLVRDTKRNPRHVKGHNDDIVLYWFAPDHDASDNVAQ